MLVPVEVIEAVDRVVPRGVTHVGFVGVNLSGEVLLTEPEGHPHGVSATFCKKRIRPGETPSQTLDRCLTEQVPYWPTSAFPIPNVWSTDESSGFYFAGLISHILPSGSSVTRQTIPGVEWYSVEVAERRIARSGKASSRRRDLALLHAAAGMILSPARRILLMLRELHGRGFERLRASPSVGWEMGAIWPDWRCDILPVSCLDRNSAMARDDEQISRLCQFLNIEYEEHHPLPWSTLGDHVPFGWPDAVWDSPEDLAQKFLTRFRDLAMAGWGSDPAYSRWLEETLLATAPHGVFHANPLDVEGAAKVGTVFTPDFRVLAGPPRP